MAPRHLGPVKNMVEMVSAKGKRRFKTNSLKVKTGESFNMLENDGHDSARGLHASHPARRDALGRQGGGEGKMRDFRIGCMAYPF